MSMPKSAGLVRERLAWSACDTLSALISPILASSWLQVGENAAEAEATAGFRFNPGVATIGWAVDTFSASLLAFEDAIVRSVCR